MTFQRFGVPIAIFLFVVLQSCKDMGDVPPTPALIATTLSVTLIPGGQTTVTISGGTPPYTISQLPAASIATATLANNANGSGSLTIQASSQNISGTTSVKVKDSDDHGTPSDSPNHEENEIEITIQVSASVVSFSAQVQPIFTNRCVNAGCHPGGSAPFSLAAGQSRGNLVNVQATVSCTSDKRVVPGDAGASVLYKKISGTTCGDRMPRNLPALNQSEVDLIRDWINQGAANN